MRRVLTVQRPNGVRLIAATFLLAAAYLLVVGIVLLLRPGAMSLVAGGFLLGGLEVAGPYMFLLAGAVGVTTGLGLLCLNNWARWIAIIIATFGVVLLIPSVSSSVVGLQMGRLAWGALGVILRVMVVWYLCQEPVAEQFSKSAKAS